jgi:hypothetical protein
MNSFLAWLRGSKKDKPTDMEARRVDYAYQPTVMTETLLYALCVGCGKRVDVGSSCGCPINSTVAKGEGRTVIFTWNEKRSGN